MGLFTINCTTGQYLRDAEKDGVFMQATWTPHEAQAILFDTKEEAQAMLDYLGKPTIANEGAVICDYKKG